VPVLGYKWAGTADLVTSGVHGYLASPGDLEDLTAGYHWIMEHRSQLSANARTRASEFDWGSIMPAYARLYHEARDLHRQEQQTTGVSAIITCYNYANYLPGAIKSLLAQSRPPAEIILVDDGSTDNSLAIMQEFGHKYSKLIRIIHREFWGSRAAGAGCPSPFPSVWTLTTN
jgi:hypothetical protein